MTEMQNIFEKQRLVELTGISEDKLTELEAASFADAALVQDDEVRRCQGLGLRKGQKLLAVRDYLSTGNQISGETTMLEIIARNKALNAEHRQSDREKLDYIFARMKLAEEDEKTLLLSKPSVSGYNKAVQDIGLTIDAPEWDPDENTKKDCRELGRPMTVFRWKPGKEDSEENRRLYMAYLNNRKNLCLPVGCKLFDGAKAGAFLSVKLAPYGIKTKGNIDVVMAARRHQNIHTTISNMWAAIELKKQDNDANNEIRRQVILQHLSATFLNKEIGILTIMTDLGRRWHFYWFSKEQNALMEYAATSKGEANYLIRHMMQDAGATSVPTDFLNRASWNEMFAPHLEGDKIMEESEGEDGEDHDDRARDSSGTTSDSPEKKRARSGTDGPQRNRPSRSSAGASGARGTAQATSHSLDFMDEEEEMEAMVTDIFECFLPQLGFFPSHGQLQRGKHADSPPRQIELS